VDELFKPYADRVVDNFAVNNSSSKLKSGFG
jgi:hypothetical protein